MKALTVQQPWAWAIIHGGKDVENRTQAWSYRGPLAIHAGMRLSQRGLNSPLIAPEDAAAESHISQYPGEARVSWRMANDTKRGVRLPMGAIIGVVDLIDTHDQHDGCCDSLWAEASYVEHGGRTRRQLVHLVLDRPRIIMAPVPCKGRLGLWDVPRDVLLDIQAELSPANGGPNQEMPK